MANTEVGAAYVTIFPQTDGNFSNQVGRKIGDGVGGGIDSKAVAIGNIMGNVVTAAASKAADLAGDTISRAFTNTGRYEQLIGGVNKLFGDASETVQGYAQRAYETAGLSANDYMDQATSFSAALISSLGGDTAKAADITDMAIQDMADNANVFGTNIESIQDAYQGFSKQNYTMLDNLKLGFGGTKSEMERLLQEAEKLTGVKYDINNLSDVYEAIHAVQEEMQITGTTASEAAGTIEGSMSKAQAAWDNFLTSLGTGEGIEEATQNLINSIGDVANNAIPALQEIFGSIGDLIISSLDEAFPGLKDTVENVMTTLQTGFMNVQTAWGPLMDTVENVMTTLQTGFENVQTALGPLIEHLGALFETLQPFIDNIAPVVGAFIETFATILATLAPIIIGIIDAVVQVATAIMDAINVVIVPALDYFNEHYSGIAQFISDACGVIKTAWDGLSSAAQTVFDGIKSVIGRDMEDAKSVASDASEGMAALMRGDFDSAAEHAASAFDTIKRNIGDKLNAAKEFVRDRANAIGEAMGFPGLGDKVAGIFDGIGRFMEDPIGAAKDFISGIIRDIENLFSWMHIQIPHFNLPHINWHWLDIGGIVSVPVFDGISWYAKGGTFDEPTIIGVGEAGTEDVVPHNPQTFSELARGIASYMGGGTSGVDIHDCTFVVREDRDIERVADELNTLINRRMAGGLA